MSVIRRVPGAVGVRAARTFDRTASQRMDAPHLSALDGAAQVAVSMWVYPTGSSNYDALLGQIGANGSGAGNASGLQILHNASDATSLFVAARNNSTGQFEVFDGLTLNAWNHVLVQFDGTQATAADRLRVYVGAGERTPFSSSGTNPATLGTTNQPFVIGADSGGSSLHWTGRQSQVAIWVGTVLSTKDIAALARGAHPSGVQPASLLECWDLDRVGPIRGLVRGTILSPVNGGSLTAGPAIQGPPRLQRSHAATFGGGATNYTLPASSGTVTVSGTAATPKYNRALGAAAGAVTATGTAASLLYLRVLAALSAALVLTGTTARTLWQRLLSAASGAWTATGTAASTLWHRVIRAETATVEVTGTDATLDYSGDTGPSVDERRKVFMLMGIYK